MLNKQNGKESQYYARNEKFACIVDLVSGLMKHTVLRYSLKNHLQLEKFLYTIIACIF